MSRLLSLVVVLALGAAPALAESRHVVRLGASARSAPEHGAAEVAPLALGAAVEVLERQGRWYKVKLPEDKQGWVHRRYLGKNPLSEGRLCARGRDLLARGNLGGAVTYLRAAMDRGTKSQPCLAALAQAYRARDQKTEEEEVRARLRKLERWLLGRWCDHAQRISLTLGEDGSYALTTEGREVGAGRYDLRNDELHLDDKTSRDRDLVLFARKRGLGRILVSRSTEELQRDFCTAQ
jgi:hypothetical protein